MSMQQKVFEQKQERNQFFNSLRQSGAKGVHRFTSLAALKRPEDGGTTWRTVYVVSFPTEGLPVEKVATETVDELIQTVIADEPQEEPITMDVTDMVSEGSPIQAAEPVVVAA